MEEEKLAHVAQLLENFKTTLQDFAVKHRSRINEDPEFRQQFHVMCAAIGVDPLASNKGFWADLLGVGNFYYDLGIVVIQICVQTRSSNGGLIYLDDLVDKLTKSDVRTRRNVNIDDIRRAVDKLKVLGSGYQIIEVYNFAEFNMNSLCLRTGIWPANALISSDRTKHRPPRASDSSSADRLRICGSASCTPSVVCREI